MLDDIRTVPGDVSTGRAQAYVALSVKVAREILALAASDSRIRGWLARSMDQVDPDRREKVLRCWAQSAPLSAQQGLSPSELLQLGQVYLEASEEDPILRSPLLQELKQILSGVVPEEESAFLRELAHYGISPERTGARAQGRSGYERRFDLKIRLAELAYTVGLPAEVERLLGQAAIRGWRSSESLTERSSCSDVLEAINRIERRDVSEWVEDLLSSDVLVVADTGGGTSQ
jgi:hypothetical protein